MNTIIEINQQNINDVMMSSQERAVIFVFYAPSQQESVEYVTQLESWVNQQQGAVLLAKVNCENEAMLAAQFRIQALPTTYLFRDGSPIDAFQGRLVDEQLFQRLNVILPKEDEVKFNQALDLLALNEYEKALPLLKEAWEFADKKNSDIGLLYAETYITLKNIESAQAILKQIPLQDRDSRWQGLQAQIDLLKQAADTPEIQQLQQDYQQNPTDAIAIKLAIQLHQAHRNDEALSLLLTILKRNLNAENGEVKQQFLSILAAIGNHDPVVQQYRRQFYSLLY
ncbi:co-chaperone YbbN [Mergibacter septicus]|uniref:Co-chaperone YbbN n=1 Tax=Mergibacter septicus TaxID=221402 RepID=A0A8E3MFL9_9PAST|nr:co-chaperone YbbN [Mergibacter septicus]AWX15109.1 co-chaperone YbbN [Mergibacter septicus]QDJ14362.1 co-chaperone YbbN [Mergibacter septicus]UTU48197.1 co-chaperone YbbN [Mergibacter septicus]WMR96184.1 co-chaperone YbbN [Mergibacter septicus]